VKAVIDDHMKYIALNYDNTIERDHAVMFFKKKFRNKFTSRRYKKAEFHNFLTNGKFLKVGLWMELRNMCQKYGFQLKMNIGSLLFEKITLQYVANFAEKLFLHNDDWTLRDDQIESVYKAIYYRFSTLDLSTAFGKTITMYTYAMLLLYIKAAKKVLIIEPDPDYVLQTYAAFEDFNRDKFDVGFGLVHGDIKKKSPQLAKSIVIGNFQTLVNLEASVFKDFDCIVVDESHRCVASSIKTILSEATNVKWKMGCSGTILRDGTADYYTLLEQIGPIVKRESKRMTIDKGNASEVKIKMIILSYPEEYRESLMRKAMVTDDKEKLLRYEQNLIREFQRRVDYIVEYVLALTGNTIVFFMDVKHEYGKKLYSAFKDHTSSCEVYYIDGDVSDDLRTIYKSGMEEIGAIRKILVASYDTFGTGKNVHNVHHLVTGESRKSPISVGQFIGRGMRMVEGKELCMVHDFVDDIVSEDFQNYMVRWSKVRRKLYKEDGLECTMERVTLSSQSPAF
jgi:superfamily II DNA or RNA helicase